MNFGFTTVHIWQAFCPLYLKCLPQLCAVLLLPVYLNILLNVLQDKMHYVMSANANLLGFFQVTSLEHF